MGLNELQAEDEAEYGPGDYVPPVRAQYYAMRVMAYGGTLLVLFAIWGIWHAARRKLPTARVFLAIAVWLVPLPLIINTAGWVLTESGRQPWIVQGLMQTVDGVSATVSPTEIILSLVAFAAVYLFLIVLDILLMTRFARRDLEAPEEALAADDRDIPALTY